jgi:hypothetical protein
VTRAPVAAFVALVVATIAAFFITQHLKISTPLIKGAPVPVPSAIDPVARRTCLVNTPVGKRRINFWRMKISFYLLNRSDDVDVYIVDRNGNIVRTLATGKFMRGGAHPVRTQFTWDGKLDDKSIAPDGTYYVRVSLIHQGRTIVISDLAGHPEPIKVITVAPHPVVTQVTPSLVARGGISVAVHYRGTENDRAFVEIYRAEVRGSPRLVKRFAVRGDNQEAIWNGEIRRHPAPAGRYLVALQAIDEACNLGTYPARLPPVTGATPNAVLTIG